MTDIKKIINNTAPTTTKSNGPSRSPAIDYSQSEFHEILKKHKPNKNAEEGLKISNHAIKRMKERNLAMDGNEFLKIKEAVTKLRNKGGRDSLVVTNQAAYIVDVDKNTIVTAIDKDSISENVFTKIDSTMFVD